KDKKFGVGITVDEFKPAELKRISYPNHSPWYVNSDSTIVNYAQNKQRIESLLYQSDKYKRLQEVKINLKKVIKGSLNLNGPGGADQIIDEAEIEKETGRKKNLLQLLNEKVKGFRTIYRGETESYKINNDNILFIIDGISLRNFGLARDILEYLDAEDVKGIEVMHRSRYTGRYRSAFLNLNELMSIDQIAFIEITTRSGNGIFFKKVPGVMIYKPAPVTYPVQFYSPKYAVKNNNDNTKDLRSTIYWNPNLVTDKNGEAHTYFYAADTPTTYSLMIQGSDLKESVGYKLGKISIK
ncbi:MAG TPA: Plug domain-containing protein, partial [Chitinophagaceae bacterium]|nr:Plug domain-containing protein [Chitinophagaceae bacterium]